MAFFTGILITFGFLALLALARWSYWYFFQYRFVEVVKGRLYRSQAMPPDVLVKTIRRHGVDTVIDLRRPANAAEAIEAEQRAVEGTGARYINSPSNQVSTAESIEAFLEAVEQSGPGRILIHCRDGRGRAVFYGAIYLIEFEGLTPDQARRKCRLVASRGTFSPGGAKGRALLDYIPRSVQPT